MLVPRAVRGDVLQVEYLSGRRYASTIVFYCEDVRIVTRRFKHVVERHLLRNYTSTVAENLDKYDARVAKSDAY